MSISDYLVDLGLVALVLLQIRGRRLTPRSFVPPFALIAWAADNYLKGIPTAGNDLLLVLLASALGATLGVGTGLATAVPPSAEGAPVAKAGALAGMLWVLGVGCRFAFQLYATHGGAAAIGRFSAAHHITSGEAWVAALLLMALGEVLGRSAVLVVRARRIGSWHPRGSATNMGAGEPAR